MGKPTGFLEFARETPAERDPLERVQDNGRQSIQKQSKP